MTSEQTAATAPDSVRSGLLQAGPLAVAGLLANAASLVVTVALARLLSPHAYGSVNQLLGLFLIMSMPGSAVAVAVVRRVTALGSPAGVRGWAARVHAQGTLALAVFSVVVVVVGGWLSHTLGQRSATGTICILIAGAVWILLSLDRGLLQAHRNYRGLAANFLVEGGTRLVVMLGLVAAGLGVAGAAAGILVAEAVTCVHARISADRSWSDGAHEPLRVRARAVVQSVLHPAPELAGERVERRHVVVDLVTAFVALAMVALLQNIDVIVVAKTNPHHSGAYAAVSVASKALVFAAIVLGGYLLPEAAIRWHQGGHALRQLGVTLVVLGVLALVALAAAVAFPRFLLSVVFSPRYVSAADAFLPLVLAMICLSVTVVLTMYVLAVGRRWMTVLLVCGAVLTTAAVVHADGAPAATAWYDLVTQGLLVTAGTWGFIQLHRRRFAESGKMQV